MATLIKQTFSKSANVSWSTMAGLVFGITRTIVIPPARAAAVPLEKSSLCVAPGSRRWTCTSMKPTQQHGKKAK